jgi:hypothetical protein
MMGGTSCRLGFLHPSVQPTVRAQRQAAKSDWPALAHRTILHMHLSSSTISVLLNSREMPIVSVQSASARYATSQGASGDLHPACVPW